MKRVHLPALGLRIVQPVGNGHYMWWSLLGWHDCNAEEDLICGKTK